MRMTAPLSSASSMTTCNSTGAPARTGQRVGELRPLPSSMGAAAAPGQCATRGPWRSARPTSPGCPRCHGPGPGHGVADHRDGARPHLALEQLGHQGLPRLDRQIAIRQGGTQRGGGRHDPGETEKVIFQGLQLGGGEVLVHRGGEPADPLTGLHQAQHRLVELRPRRRDGRGSATHARAAGTSGARTAAQARPPIGAPGPRPCRSGGRASRHARTDGRMVVSVRRRSVARWPGPAARSLRGRPPGRGAHAWPDASRTADV